MDNNFTNKETYLAYRAEWKAQYKQLSIEIRQAKLDLKKAQREGSATWRHFRACSNGKAKARDMLAQLHGAKEKAQQLWALQRENA